MSEELLLPHQIALLESVTPYTLMIAGRGVGKSQGASRLVIKLLAEHKSTIISGPTYKQLKIVLFKAVEEALKIHKIPYHLNKAQMIFTIFLGAETLYIYGVSADSYETARGYTNVTALIIDEAALHTKECLDVLTACCRGQFDPVTKVPFKPQVYMVTTPRGSSNWTARYLDHPECTVISCGTKDNFFLSDAYISLLESQYSGDFYRQEILGEIVDSITLALVSQADVNRMKSLPRVMNTTYRKIIIGWRCFGTSHKTGRKFP
jgi:PBSX family phage terminase large subunit